MREKVDVDVIFRINELGRILHINELGGTPMDFSYIKPVIYIYTIKALKFYRFCKFYKLMSWQCIYTTIRDVLSVILINH